MLYYLAGLSALFTLMPNVQRFWEKWKGKIWREEKKKQHRYIEKVEPESEASTKMWACEQNWENEIFRNDITRATARGGEMRSTHQRARK